MRRSFFTFVFSLTLVLAGCSSSPAPETAEEKSPEAAPAAESAPAPDPAAAEAPSGAETAPPPASSAQPVAVNTEEEKTIYAMGLVMARNLTDFNLSPKELEIVKRALSDAQANKPLVNIETYGPKLSDFAGARQKAAVPLNKNQGKEYAAKAAKEPGAKQTASGMVYRELKAGSGASPKVSDQVRIHYRGTLLNGTEFDSSYKRNQPAEFPLGNLIQCWQEGIPMMKIGGKAQLVCPSDIAYKDEGRPGIPGGATLLFEVELLGIL